MASHGAHAVVLDLVRAEPAAAAQQLGPGHLRLVADVTDKASCEVAISEVLHCIRSDFYMVIIM